MPARKQISKEKILQAAIQIIKKQGGEALSMRTIAAECNCSTQPLYLSFSGIDEIKDCLYNEIDNLMNRTIDKEIAKKQYPEYKAVGMGYIRFAKEESNLFKFLMFRDRKKETNWEKESFDASTYLIMKNYGLYKDDAAKLHAEMWVFVHGIATMFATGYLDWELDTVSNMVTDAYKGLITQIKEGKNDNPN